MEDIALQTTSNTNSQHLSHPQIFFMPGVFNETMQLLTEARDYFQTYGEEDQAQINEFLRSIYASEMSRITLRLSTIMAWTMAQRAVLAGKITQEDAALHHALGYQDVCRVDSSVLHEVLPGYVCHLLDRSHELYERVARLDERFRQQLN
jgi:regulator of CtrA degradation